ncbi:hypothetical protein [Paraflavitalea speifideaquila]|nr:hypothetical protein [Paraflavitalea speifideiaquila]
MDHLAVILDLTNTRLTGFIVLIQYFLLRRAKRPGRKGYWNGWKTGIGR